MTMPAYVIGTMTVTDPEAQAASFAEFRAKAEASIELYGGRRIVAGPVAEVLEGAIAPNAGSVLEFDDHETIRRWFASPEYTEVCEIRDRFATGFHLVIPGH
jgi:uncharacterized protein (DUF1330 family)